MVLGDVIISESDIAHVVPEIASEIRQDLEDEDLLLIGVMDGAVCFLADLMRAMPDRVDVTTVRVRSYSGTESGEISVDWLPPRTAVEGRRVLIVDDIVDTGATASLLVGLVRQLGAASVEVCALLDKPSRRAHDIEVAYAGFDIEDVFVVGYGLDYNGRYRNLREVRELVQEP